MAILITRPAPDNEKTAAALRVRGFEVLLSPTLRFETMDIYDDHDAAYDGVILTSANAVRAIEGRDMKARIVALPAFAVGAHTAETARSAGFTSVVTGKGEASMLRDVVANSAEGKKLRKGATLCYLAGADLARDLAADLGERGFTVITHTVYRMIPVTTFSKDVEDAFRSGGIDAALQFSRRSARAFLGAVRAAGVEISALALPQYCLSDAVAAILREGGATQVVAAQAPNETALFDALEKNLKPASR